MLNAKTGLTVLAALLLFPRTPLLGQTGQPTNDGVNIQIGTTQYRMSDFNRKLRAEGNQRIGERVNNVGVEFDLVTVPSALVRGFAIKIPVGFEYLGANSKTRHPFPSGMVTVNWNLPVAGWYIAPTFDLSRRIAIKAGVGDYRLVRANLAVSDRPGHLDVDGRAIGTIALARVQFQRGQRALFGEAGVRRLIFNDVRVSSKDGFPEEAGGALLKAGSSNESLEYSGVVVRGGISVRF